MCGCLRTRGATQQLSLGALLDQPGGASSGRQDKQRREHIYGEARFLPPALPQPWSAPRDALAYGPMAPQVSAEDAYGGFPAKFRCRWEHVHDPAGERP